jgi:hypothetical protein
MAVYDRQVFLNVPFDARYQKLLRALVFAVHECGLEARCAQEKDDGGEARVEKLLEIIAHCRFGIHDLSRTTLDSKNRLPRFNMPLELGLFLGARRYGDRAQRKKACLILDRDRYRYQIFCSDIAGQDIRAHDNTVGKTIAAVRQWLQTHLPAAARLPGPAAIEDRYIDFQRQLPFMCGLANVRPSEMSFLDYRVLVDAWRAENPSRWHRVSS